MITNESFPETTNTEIDEFFNAILDRKAYTCIKSKFTTIIYKDFDIGQVQSFLTKLGMLSKEEFDYVETTLIKLHDDYYQSISTEKNVKNIEALKRTQNYKNNTPLGTHNMKMKDIVGFGENILDTNSISEKVSILKMLCIGAFIIRQSHDSNLKVKEYEEVYNIVVKYKFLFKTYFKLPLFFYIIVIICFTFTIIVQYRILYESFSYLIK